MIVGKPLRLDNTGNFNATLKSAVKTDGTVSLDKVGDAAQENRKRAPRRLKLSNTQLKNKGLFNVGASVSSSMCDTLSSLWKQYAMKLLTEKVSLQDLQLKVAMGDLHGAHVRITSSKNPSYVGVSGVVVQETCRSFLLAIPANDNYVCRMFLKGESVFEVDVPVADGDNGSRTVAVQVHGMHFEYTPGMRSKNKLKPRATLNYLA